jgi:hypothetical protein
MMQDKKKWFKWIASALILCAAEFQEPEAK